MKPTRVVQLLCAVLAIAVLAPPSASAATRIYEGGISDVGGTLFSFDVETKRVRGKQVRTVTQVRGTDIPEYCEGSSSFDGDPSFRADARVTRGGSFEVARSGTTEQGYDFLYYIRGRIDGDRASGRFSFTGQNPVFTSCSTGVVRFYGDRVTK